MSSSPARYSFEIPPQGLRELAEVAEFANRLNDVEIALDKVGPSATTEVVAEALGIDPKNAGFILRGLVSLRALADGTNLSPEGLFDAITDSIGATASTEWTQAHFQKWKSAREQLIAAIAKGKSDDVLGVRGKIRELTYLHENILDSCRLLTELRPVFNNVGDAIVNTVLTTTLLIRYRGHGRVQQMQFEMDLDDVSDLRAQCERAERKVATADRMFKQVGWALTIAGSRKEEVK